MPKVVVVELGNVAAIADNVAEAKEKLAKLVEREEGRARSFVIATVIPGASRRFTPRTTLQEAPFEP